MIRSAVVRSFLAAAVPEAARAPTPTAGDARPPLASLIADYRNAFDRFAEVDGNEDALVTDWASAAASVSAALLELLAHRPSSWDEFSVKFSALVAGVEDEAEHFIFSALAADVRLLLAGGAP